MNRTEPPPTGRTPPGADPKLQAKSLRVKKITNGYVVVDAEGKEAFYTSLAPSILMPPDRWASPRTVVEHLMRDLYVQDLYPTVADEEDNRGNQRAA